MSDERSRTAAHDRAAALAAGAALGAPAALLLAAGMPRSGSTWLYNALRLLLQRNRYEYRSGWLDDVKDAVGTRPLLLKVHDFEPSLVERSVAVAYSFRDLRDALASARRKFGRVPSLSHARRLVEQFERWTAAADFVVRYETMISRPLDTLEALGAAFGLSVGDAAAVQAELAALSYDASGDVNGRYNTVNLMHEGHVTDGRHGSWLGELTPGFLRDLEREFRPWFAANGYPLSFAGESP